MNLLAVFRSRTISMQVYNVLNRSNVACALVSTPREASVGCGLSVKFAENDYNMVVSIAMNAPTFVGIYRISIINGRRTLTRL